MNTATITRVWLGVCALLGAVLIRELLVPAGAVAPDSAPATVARGEDDVATQREPVTPPPIASFSALLERPLFSPGRQMAAAPAAPLTEPAAPLPVPAALVPTRLAQSLLGVARVEGRSVVLLRGANAGVIRLGPGAVIDGWTLVEARPDGVVFEREGARAELPLYAPTAGSHDPEATVPDTHATRRDAPPNGDAQARAGAPTP